MSLWLVACFSALIAKDAGPQIPQVEIRGQKFQVELAISRSEWMKGLMFREKLGKRQGMLFVGDTERPQSFWMKNTYVPLDIIFISKDLKIVKIQANAVPLTLDPLPSERPAQYVLEILAGEAQKIGMKEGDVVKFIHVGSPASSASPTSANQSKPKLDRGVQKKRP